MGTEKRTVPFGVSRGDEIMVYELADTAKVTALFGGWSETMIWSCLQKVMGKIYVTDLEKPQSAFAFVGCFVFYAGETDKELPALKKKK